MGFLKLNTKISSCSKRTQVLAKNAVGSFVIKCFSIVVDFAKVPVLLTFLDKDYYGVYLTIASIVAWTQQFDFGLGTGLRYKLTESLSLHQTEKSRQLVSTAYLTMTSLMVLVLLLGISIVSMLDWQKILNCYFIDGHELILCVCLVLSIFVFQLILDLVTIVLQANQKAALSSVFKPLANTITLLIIFLVRNSFHNSLMIACLALTLPIAIVLLIANIFFFHKYFAEISPRISYFCKDCIKDIYSLGLKFFISQLAVLVVFSSSSFLLSHYINPSEAAVYNTAWTYFGVLVMFNNMVLQPLVATVTDAYVNNDENWIRNIFRKIRLYSIFLTLASLFLLILSPFLIKLWIGGVLIIPFKLSILMTVYFIINIWITPYLNFLAGVGKFKLMMFVSIMKIMFFFPISIALIKVVGIEGMIISIILINTLPNGILSYIQYKKIISHKAAGIWNE